MSLKDNIKKDCFECKNCHFRTHRECKEAIGDDAVCFARMEAPTYAIGARVRARTLEGAWTVESVDRETGTLRVRKGSDFHYIWATECTAEEVPPVMGAHTHVMRETKLHKPTWCHSCQKFIWGRNAHKCELCGCVVHEKCLSSLPKSVVAA